MEGKDLYLIWWSSMQECWHRLPVSVPFQILEFCVVFAADTFSVLCYFSILM